METDTKLTNRQLDMAMGTRYKRCPVCGKQFMTFGQWGYVLKTKNKAEDKYFCGYTCYRAEERKWEAKENKRWHIGEPLARYESYF